MLKFKYVDGCTEEAHGRLSSQKFPPSIVEPDDAYTIRQIYDCWRKGKPTSVHPFNAEFDEESSRFDDSDHFDDFRENPHDISQVENDFADARDTYLSEVQESKKKLNNKTTKPKEESIEESTH